MAHPAGNGELGERPIQWLRSKFEQYKSIPAFAEYLLGAQDRVHVARRIKRDDGSWNETVFESLSAVIHIDTAGIDLALSEIYEGIPIVGVIE